MRERLTTNQRIAINAIKRQSSITVILDTGERLIFTGQEDLSRDCYCITERMSQAE